MARFLITYHAGDMPQDPESIAQVRRAFTQWATKAAAALADIGTPIRVNNHNLKQRNPRRSVV